MEEIEPSSITGLRMGVTSGPTRAWIDPVRYIANASTGELGALIADRLAERGASVELIAGQGAVLPQHPSVRIHSIETIQDLENGLQSLAADAGSPFTAWIHAMAVLDYVPENTSPTKIASGEPVLKMTLNPTPKIIHRFRTLFPECVLVGFKLETTEIIEDLRRSALRLSERYGCDLVIANVCPFHNPQNHEAYFWDRSLLSWTGPIRGKTDIARNLVTWLEAKTSPHVSP